MEPNEFIPYDQSLELKGLSFNEECIAYYQPSTTSEGWDLIEDGMLHINSTLEIGVTAPTYSHSFRWFRLNYNWNIHIFTLWDGGWDYYIYQQPDDPITDDGITYSTYDEAELACLNKLIQTVKTI
jgi:hypothetical protein